MSIFQSKSMGVNSDYSLKILIQGLELIDKIPLSEEISERVISTAIATLCNEYIKYNYRTVMGRNTKKGGTHNSASKKSTVFVCT